jgi:hypothetical protein
MVQSLALKRNTVSPRQVDTQSDPFLLDFPSLDPQGCPSKNQPTIIQIHVVWLKGY